MSLTRDIFCFTDIHGCRPLFDAIMNYCYKQDPEGMVLFLGDAIDRGTDGYSIMKELLANPQVVYLKGNHEDMFVQAAREIQEMLRFEELNEEYIHRILNSCLLFDYRYAAIQDSLMNGGLPTLTDWILDGMPMDIIERIDHLPYTFIYGKLDFSHAASAPQVFARVCESEYEGDGPDKYDAQSILWSRTLLQDEWTPGRIAVFGHTPVPYLYEYIGDKSRKNMPTLFNNGTKLDMDTGAVFTGKAYVLNVLTMQAQGFELKNGKVEEIEVIQF